jgi:hypothetical protein
MRNSKKFKDVEKFNLGMKILCDKIKFHKHFKFDILSIHLSKVWVWNCDKSIFIALKIKLY